MVFINKTSSLKKVTTTSKRKIGRGKGRTWGKLDDTLIKTPTRRRRLLTTFLAQWFSAKNPFSASFLRWHKKMAFLPFPTIAGQPLDQHCPTELSVVIKMFCIYTVQQGSPLPHVAIEQKDVM